MDAGDHTRIVWSGRSHHYHATYVRHGLRASIDAVAGVRTPQAPATDNRATTYMTNHDSDNQVTRFPLGRDYSDPKNPRRFRLVFYEINCAVDLLTKSTQKPRHDFQLMQQNIRLG